MVGITHAQHFSNLLIGPIDVLGNEVLVPSKVLVEVLFMVPLLSLNLLIQIAARPQIDIRRDSLCLNSDVWF